MFFQRINSSLAGSHLSYLLFSLFSGLLGSSIFYAGDHYRTAYRVSHSRDPEWPLRQGRERQDIRNDIASRDLISALGDLFQGALPSTDAGALSGILTTIESSITKLLGDPGGSLIDGLAGPSKFLGIGLASGALTGLNMTAPNLPTATGVSNLAENLGSGLSSTIFSSNSIKSLLDNTNAGPGGTLGGSDGTVGQAVLALGQGLGSGASFGLNLSTAARATTAYNTTGINGIAGNFGEGLTSSLLANVQLPSGQSLLDTLKNTFGGSNTTINVADVGTAFGSGLGEGAAIGLGYQVDSDSPPETVPGIVEGFTKGLVSSFLQNDTAGKLIDSLKSANSSFTLPNVDFAKVAEGLAVGFVSGIGSTISTLDLISANTTYFNDSVGGAATGFGRGLGSEGAKLVSEILDGNQIKKSTNTTSVGQLNGISSRIKRRWVHKKRAEEANATDLASVLSNLNASNINPLVQSGMDALTCEGVGGLGAILFGLVKSKTIKLGSISLKDLTSSSPTIGNVSLPDQDFVIKSGGNTYQLNPAKGLGSVSVNGLGIYALIGVAAAHIIFAILAHFAAIPLFVLAFNYFKVTRMLNKSASMGSAPLLPKWLIWLGYSIIPLTFITFSLGIAFKAGGKHFRTPHEILGFVVFLQTILAAAITQYLRQNPRPTDGSKRTLLAKRLKIVNMVNLVVLFLLTELTLLFSFEDLSSLSLCISQTVIPTSIWAGMGWVLMGPLTLATGLQALLLWLKWLEHRKKNAGKVAVVKDVENTKLNGTAAKIQTIEKPKPLQIRHLEV